MKRWMIFIIFFLLLIGFVLFRMINGDADVTQPEEDFRSWFWDYRMMDLAVQILLIFGGSLGIAAIFPFEDGKND